MKRALTGVSVMLVLFWGLFVFAQTQEHPKTQEEHPKKQEHPKKSEHPTQKMTTEDIDGAIRAHITDESESDGMFHVDDTVLNKEWNLTLVKVHKDKLTALDASNYFACVDFKADDGTAVDVDFYLKNEDGKLVVTDTTVHKINNQARFMYEEKDGFWQRVDTKASEHPAEAKAKEHPKKEHPAKKTEEHPKESSDDDDDD